jgi:hypothetical protein
VAFSEKIICVAFGRYSISQSNVPGSFTFGVGAGVVDTGEGVGAGVGTVSNTWAILALTLPIAI